MPRPTARCARAGCPRLEAVAVGFLRDAPGATDGATRSVPSPLRAPRIKPTATASSRGAQGAANHNFNNSPVIPTLSPWDWRNPAGYADKSATVNTRALQSLLICLAALATRSACGQDPEFASDQVPAGPPTPSPVVNPKPEPGPTATGQSAVLAGWDDKAGFLLKSADDRFQLRITGQVQSDYRYYLNNRDTTDFDNFLIRRARLGIEATVFGNYEFRLLPGFEAGSTRFQDAYLNARWWEEFQFEAGKFKQPFSYEQLIQDRFVPTLERSLFDQLVPQRDVGLMFHGYKLFDDRFDYQASAFNGEINGDSDTDKNKEFAGRVVVRPLRELGLPDWLEPIQLGIAGTFGNDFGALGPTTLRTPAFVTWFVYSSATKPDGTRTRWSPELVYYYGPFGFAAQYFEERQELLAPAGRTSPATEVTVKYRGGYVLATLLLTGEEREAFSHAITPLGPFDPPHCMGPGAWELVGRVSRLTLDTDNPRAFVRIMDPTRSATEATELTAGFNWYWNRWVRMQFNWELDRFDNAIRLGSTTANRLNHQNSFITRFQIIF
jgi:phosphate-selective porin OprO/OprP